MVNSSSSPRTAQKRLQEIRERLEKVWKSSGRALGVCIYRKTPDQPPQRPLCYQFMARLGYRGDGMYRV